MNFLLLDADILTYKVGFACDATTEKVCLHEVDKVISDTMEATDSGDYMGYLTGGKDNFRFKIATIQAYKGNRKPDHRPRHYAAIRQHLQSAHGCVMETEQEADDAIGIDHFNRASEDVVIASIDKDLLMIPGQHYNLTTRKMQYVTKEAAELNFWLSVLTGDRADNIPGIHGVGPVKARKLLEADIEPWPSHEYYKCLVAYSDWYQKTMETGYMQAAVDHIDEVGQLLWIRRVAGEVWRCDTHQDFYRDNYGAFK